MNSSSHFEHLTKYQLMMCKTCQYAVWSNQIKQHYQKINHKWRRQKAQNLKTIVQSWFNVLQYSIELIVFKQMDTAIFVLKLHINDLLCQFNFIECQYICCNKNGMRIHCLRKHEWFKQKRKNNVNRKNIERKTFESWISVYCQRFFTHQQDFQFFVIK